LRALAVTLALATSGGVPLALATTTQARATAPRASVASCVYGRIGGQTKCLRRGEYCSYRLRRQYPRYGFVCGKRDRRGDYHLEYS
jgi:hypothetical protein